jgi:hypothetical protein
MSMPNTPEGDEWYCSCSQRCIEKKSVSKTTYYEHRPFRDADYREDLRRRTRGMSDQPTGVPSVGRCGNGVHFFALDVMFL